MCSQACNCQKAAVVAVLLVARLKLPRLVLSSKVMAVVGEVSRTKEEV